MDGLSAEYTQAAERGPDYIVELAVASEPAEVQEQAVVSEPAAESEQAVMSGQAEAQVLIPAQSSHKVHSEPLPYCRQLRKCE